MASSINGLLKSAGVNPNRLHTIRWGEPMRNSTIGIFFVSLSAKPDANAMVLSEAPLDETKLSAWISSPGDILCLDGEPCTDTGLLRQRMNQFWLPEESIVYIGQVFSMGGIKKRIDQLYKTGPGKRMQNVDGYWIKSLRNLNEMYIHYISVMNAEQISAGIIARFSSQAKCGPNVRPDKLASETIVPFANLQNKMPYLKNHGITWVKRMQQAEKLS